MPNCLAPVGPRSNSQVGRNVPCPCSRELFFTVLFSPDVVGVIGAGLPPGLPPCFRFPNKSNINQVELVRIPKGLEQMIGERATP